MRLQDVVALCVGVAVFILGMLMMKYSLEKAFGKKLEEYLKRFTGNRFSGIFTGTLITVALQSSSASSVLTAALVDSGMLSLWGAFWIIVGANIGTTFTGLLTAFSFTEFAPLLTVLGIVLFTVSKREKFYAPALFLTGFGLLFVGMDIMGNAADGIKNSPFASSVLVSCSSEFTGLLTGCFFTAVIQSSSAVTALLQTLASEGIIGISQAFYIILGSNIGTCATCAIASIGLKNGAKKVSLMHIGYNFAGVLLFCVLARFIPFSEIAEIYFPGNIGTQIAFINITFNVLTAIPVLFVPQKEMKNKNIFSAFNHLQQRKTVLK